jgi:tetratricopeptide (TPR) repeat protein
MGRNTKGVLVINPFEEFFAGLGRVYARRGEFEKAVAALTEAIRLDGEEAEYYPELAQIYQAEEHSRDAIENWKKAKELEARPEILLALGDAYLANEQHSAAVREYQELLQLAPEIEGVREQLAKALRAEGREAEARGVEERRESLPK